MSRINKKSKFKRFICRIFGHKIVQYQALKARSDGTKKKGKWSLNSTMAHRPGNRHYVIVTWQECARCGKKLSNIHRIKGL